MTLEKARKRLKDFSEKSKSSSYSYTDMVLSQKMTQKLSLEFPWLNFTVCGSITTVRYNHSFTDESSMS